jgi:predicted transcriptional regulator
LLEALTEKLGAFIKKNPGQRIEQIGKALGTPTKELALPVKKLLAAKRIATRGQKRSTKYFPR